MMASSEFHSNAVLLDQIDSALLLWGDGISVTDIKEESHLKLGSFQEMYDAYDQLDDLEVYNYPGISYDLTFGESVPTSLLIGDEKLLEAIFFSKIIENSSEFDSNRADYRGKLVWVRKKGTEVLYLVSQNQIVYEIFINEIEPMRSKVQKYWDDIFKQRVRKNLLEAVKMPASQDWSKYVSDVQSSFGGAPSASSAVSDANPPKYPLTEELKKIFLDELNSLQLDPVIKQKFVFDLKVLPDRDILYWRERLDHLRSLSSVASSQQLQRLSQAVADLEKLVREKSAETSTLAETLPKLEEKMVDHVDRTVDEVKVNGGKLQQLVDSMSTLLRTFEGNETSLSKMSVQSSASVKTDHLKEIIGELKTDLMETTNGYLKTSSSSIEYKLNEVKAAVDRVEASIQSTTFGLPVLQHQLVEQEAKILTQLDPLKISDDNLKKEIGAVKGYLMQLCSRFGVWPNFFSPNNVSHNSC